MISSESGFSWFTVRVAPQCEAKVSKRAKDFEIETYYPIERSLVPARNGLTMRAEPMIRPAIPGYLFARLAIDKPRFDLFHPPTMRDLHSSIRSKIEPINRIGQMVEFDASAPLSIAGAQGILSTPAGPEPVADAIIADLKERESSGEFDFTQRDGKYYLPRWIKRGKVALVIAGPFKGMTGSIERTINYRTIVLWLPVFGQVTTVELPLTFIERARWR